MRVMKNVLIAAGFLLLAALGAIVAMWTGIIAGLLYSALMGR